MSSGDSISGYSIGCGSGNVLSIGNQVNNGISNYDTVKQCPQCKAFYYTSQVHYCNENNPFYNSILNTLGSQKHKLSLQMGTYKMTITKDSYAVFNSEGGVSGIYDKLDTAKEAARDNAIKFKSKYYVLKVCFVCGPKTELVEEEVK